MSKPTPDTDIAAILRAAEENRDSDVRRAWAEYASVAVRTSKSKRFDDLARASGLRPERDFRLADWRGMDFSGCNLRGFDFSGARLWGAKFEGALIAAGPDRDGNAAPAAAFDQAEWSAVDHDREPGSTAPGVLLAPVADVSMATDYDAYLRAWKPTSMRLGRPHLRTGAIFQDAPFAPEMVVVPSGTFWMGSREGVGAKNERPRHQVGIAHRIAVGRVPVTFEEWEACFSDGRAIHKPNESWNRRRQPINGVSWKSITKEFLPCLNKRLGLSGVQAYRLLSEAEWEFCCRAGTETAFCFGDTISGSQARFLEDEIATATRMTVEVGAFPANAWGLHDMHGNVWEWCQDDYHDSYDGAPNDGSAREHAPKRKGRSFSRVIRGGSGSFRLPILRSANRDHARTSNRSPDLGFRVARTLP